MARQADTVLPMVRGTRYGPMRLTPFSRRVSMASIWFRVEAPPELSRYIAEKGSICIDGVSLTVNELRGDAFRVNVIPHTARSTHMTTRRPGEGVNLEVDVLARYVERLLRAESGGGNLSFERLRALGYTGKER